VSVEGIEGSGKSTLLAGLLARLRAEGIEVEATREPGGTALGDRLRAAFVDLAVKPTPVAEAMLLNASRAQLVAEVIAPALAAGRWVLSDRFSTATLAYQGYGRRLNLEFLRGLASAAIQGVEPDLVLLIDIPVDLSHRRVAARAAATGAAVDRLEREEMVFHQRVRAGYLALAATDEKIVVLDGARPPEVVLEEACAALRARFGPG
jgi:dTMP kinase